MPEQRIIRWAVLGVLALAGFLIAVHAAMGDGHYVDLEECLYFEDDIVYCSILFPPPLPPTPTPEPTPPPPPPPPPDPPAPSGKVSASRTSIYLEERVEIRVSDVRPLNLRVRLIPSPQLLSESEALDGLCDYDIARGAAVVGSTAPFTREYIGCYVGSGTVRLVRSSDGRELDSVRVTVLRLNGPPTFNEGDSATRSVDENMPAGRDVGDPVSASDPDDDALTYSLSGTDAGSFAIVTSSGQIQTSAGLDYETKRSYSVTVRVTDSKGSYGNANSRIDDTITVTINVVDVNERPVVVSQIANQTLTVGGGTRTIQLSGKFRDPDGDTLEYGAVSSDGGVVTESVSGGTLTITPVGTGTATVTVTAYDRSVGHAVRMSASQTLR